MAGMLEVLEELTYRRSTRCDFFSLSLNEAAKRYGLSLADCLALRAPGQTAYEASLPFNNSMFGSAFPLSVRCLETERLLPQDGVAQLFDRADTELPRSAVMAAQLAYWGAKHSTAAAMRLLIGWEALQLVAPDATSRKGFRSEISEQSVSAAWLVTSPMDCDALPDVMKTTTSADPGLCNNCETALYIVKPDPLGRHKSRARYWTISALVHAIALANIQLYESDEVASVRAEPSQFESSFADFLRQCGISRLVPVDLSEWNFS